MSSNPPPDIEPAAPSTVESPLLISDSLATDGGWDAIATLGYSKTAGNRWERPLASGATAAIDLLVPAYTSRPRSSVQIGSTNTTEVPGLAFALRRPAVACTARFMSSQRALRTARVSVPDEPSLLGLKTLVRTVRDEFRDCEDIWRCLEILYVSGRGDDFKTDPAFNAARTVLAHQVAPNGAAMAKLLDRTAPQNATDVAPESPHSSAASPDRRGDNLTILATAVGSVNAETGLRRHGDAATQTWLRWHRDHRHRHRQDQATPPQATHRRRCGTRSKTRRCER